MSTTYEVVIGWSAPIDITLYSKGAAPAGLLTGMSAALILRDPQTGVTLDTTSDVTIPDTAVWSVRYTPDTADLIPGVYRGRVKITDGTGQVSYFPSGEWDNWIIRSET